MNEIFELIRKERERQVVAKGYTFEQDDKRVNGELADAAAFYAMSGDAVAFMEEVSGNEFELLIDGFKLNSHSRNPKDRIGDLVKAAALIVAEIQRIKRAQQ